MAGWPTSSWREWTAAAGSFALAIMEPSKSLDGCISAAVACVTNVGPAFGEFGPIEHYGDIGPWSKLLLCGLMVPEDYTDEHLEILATLAGAFNEETFCDSLRTAKSSDELHRLLINWQPEQQAS